MLVNRFISKNVVTQEVAVIPRNIYLVVVVFFCFIALILSSVVFSATWSMAEDPGHSPNPGK